MTRRLRVELRRSEIRTRLSEIRALAESEVTDAIKKERGELEAELVSSETELRAAIEEEEREIRQRGNQANGNDGESAELRELRGRVTLAAYIGAAIEGRAAEGPEREFNQALGVPAGRFPLELLAPREVRATTDVDAAAMQRTWLDRLFADTSAMYAGVTFESVMPGVSAHPVVTAGASAAQRGRGEAAADAAWDRGRERNQAHQERRAGRLQRRGCRPAARPGGRAAARRVDGADRGH